MKFQVNSRASFHPFKKNKYKGLPVQEREIGGICMINRSLVQERLLLVLNFHNELFELSKMNNEEFLAESRNVAAAESYLRRSLEAIFDIGRHVLAKTGNIKLSLEYEAIA